MALVDKMVYIDNHILRFSEPFPRWLFSNHQRLEARGLALSVYFCDWYGSVQSAY